MTRVLKHPVLGEPLQKPQAVEAAVASMSYWTAPKAVAVKGADGSAIEQMYAYFG